VLNRLHTLVVKKEGYLPWTEQFKTNANNSTLRFSPQLEPTSTGGAPAKMQLDSKQLEISVYLDGEIKGKVPLTLELRSGVPHTLVLKKPGFEDKIIKVPPLAPELLQREDVTLEEKKASPQRPPPLTKIAPVQSDHGNKEKITIPRAAPRHLGANQEGQRVPPAKH
jgi:hypothetical protein